MSEKKLRKILELTDAEVNHMYDVFMEAAKHRRGAVLKGLIPSAENLRKKSNKTRKQALSEPPDVVALLRWAYEQHAWTQLGSPTAYTSIRCETLWDVIKELEKIVRLADDGWEWVEED